MYATHSHVLAVPDAVSNCSVMNMSLPVPYITCVAGNDGGLSQSFFLQFTYGRNITHVISEVNNKLPVFQIPALPADTPYRAIIHAANRKGKGQSVNIQGFSDGIPQSLPGKS